MKTADQVQNAGHHSKYAGISPVLSKRRRAARKCRTAGELKVIWVSQSTEPATHIETAADAAAYWRKHVPQSSWFDPLKECAVVLIMNARNKIIGHNLVTIGTVNSCLMHAREIFRPVIAAAGSSLIVTHNHPAGDPSPSGADIIATTQLIQAGCVLGIDVVDHLVIGQGEEFFSIRRSGMCNFDLDKRGDNWRKNLPAPIREWGTV